MDEFHRLLLSAPNGLRHRHRIAADATNPISNAAAGGLRATLVLPEGPTSAHQRRAAHPSPRLHAAADSDDDEADSIDCCDIDSNDDAYVDEDDKHLDWYTRLASRCHRDGFQWHVDYLLERNAANSAPLIRRPLQRLVDQRRQEQRHQRPRTASAPSTTPHCAPSNNTSGKCFDIIRSDSAPFERLCRPPHRCTPHQYDFEDGAGQCTMHVVRSPDVTTTNGHIRDIDFDRRATPNNNNNIHGVANDDDDNDDDAANDSAIGTLADAICALSVVDHHHHHHHHGAQQRRRDAAGRTYLLPQITLTDCCATTTSEQVPLLRPTPTASPTHAGASHSFISARQ